MGRLGLLGFFVRRVLLTMIAELAELKTFLKLLLVLAGMVVHPLAHCALQIDEIVLRHRDFIRGEPTINAQMGQDWPGAACRTRTGDLHFTKVLLYQLS